MPTHDPASLMAGVIEGFYGQPWTQAERFQLFDWMPGWGLNTYFYCPKDDLKHRAFWRECYSAEELARLGELISACHGRGLRFIYGLSPGLDIRYSDPAELDCILARLTQMMELGCRNFCLLFDDIPDRMDARDIERWGSLASAQAQTANAVFRWVLERSPDSMLLFCPTPYCGRMALRQLGGEGYLETLGRELLPEAGIFWTGPEIVSEEITVAHMQELRGRLRRKPVLWDNLHANDYDGRRAYLGPYSGRPAAVRAEIGGLLVNPNNEFWLNFPAFHTLAAYLRCERDWDARRAYLDAMKAWLPAFAAPGVPLKEEDLVLLGDSFYLPYALGPGARDLHAGLKELLAMPPAEWGGRGQNVLAVCSRLREFCGRLTELNHRPLFYALSRRVWELREELDLIERYIRWQDGPGSRGERCSSDFHRPGTYRGGMVPALQQLLQQRPDGTFSPSSGQGTP